MSKNQTLTKSKKIKLVTKTLATNKIFLKASKSIILFFKKTAINLKKTVVAKTK